MSDNIKMGPNTHDVVWTSITVGVDAMVESGGTFDSQVYLACEEDWTHAGTWWFTLFDARTGGPDTALHSGQMTLKMPEDYKSGTDVKIRFYWTSSEGANDVEWTIGLCQQNGTRLGTETETEYITFADTVNGAVGEWWANRTAIQTFDGSGLSPDDIIGIVLLRDEEGPTDSAVQGAYIANVEIIYQRDTIGEEAVDDSNRHMTPQQFQPVYRSVDFQAQEMYSFASIQDSVGASAATTGLLNERWQALQMDPDIRQYANINWIAPPDLVPGTTISVKSKITGSIGSTQTVYVRAGLAVCPPNTEYSLDDGTGSGIEWVNVFGKIGRSMPSVAGTITVIPHTQLTTTLNPGDLVSLSILRNATDAITDTYTGVMNLIAVTIQYQVQDHGEQTI